MCTIIRSSAEVSLQTNCFIFIEFLPFPIFIMILATDVMSSGVMTGYMKPKAGSPRFRENDICCTWRRQKWDAVDCNGTDSSNIFFL